MRIDPTKSNRFFLEQGESLFLEPGAMLAFQNCRMKTEMAAGGILKQMQLYFLGGEQLLRNRFTAENGKAWISVEEQMPGQILCEKLKAGEPGLMIRNGAYLGHAGAVVLETRFQGIRGYMEGKGFTGVRAFVQEGEGTVLFHASGSKVEKIEVDPSKGPVTIDNSMILAHSENLDCKLTRTGKGMKSTLFSGEGLVCEFKGRGVVYVSTGEQERDTTLFNMACESASKRLCAYGKIALFAGTVLSAVGALYYFATGENIVHRIGDEMVCVVSPERYAADQAKECYVDTGEDTGENLARLFIDELVSKTVRVVNPERYAADKALACHLRAADFSKFSYTAFRKNLHFRQFGAIDPSFPIDSVVDRIVEFVKSLEKGMSAIFYCGDNNISNDPLMNSIIEILFDKRNRSVNFFLENPLRTSRIPKVFRNYDNPLPKQIERFENKKEFIRRFYDYCKENRPSFSISWSEWNRRKQFLS